MQGKHVIDHIKQIYSYRELLSSLIARDIKIRGKQSFLGYLWIILNPLFSIVIFTVIIAVFLDTKFMETPYPVFLACTLLPWNFFSNTLEASMWSVVSHTSLITQIAFPKELLPIAAVIRSLFDFGLSLVMFIVLMLIYQEPMHLTAIFFPGLLLIQITLTLGLAFYLSALNVYYRDVSYFVGILLRGWMFLSPVIYPVDRVPAKYAFWYMLNPMTPLINGYRQLLLTGQVPDMGYILYVSVIAIGILGSGYYVFKKLEPTFADVV